MAAATIRDGDAVAADLGGNHDHRRADQRRDRVEAGAEHDWNRSEKDVPEHASADAGDRAEHDRRDGSDSVVERGARTGDAEQSKPGRVEHETGRSRRASIGAATNLAPTPRPVVSVGDLRPSAGPPAC